MNEWFEQDWAGIAQVFVIRRSVKTGEKEREEMVYGLTNLPRKKANAKRLLGTAPRESLLPALRTTSSSDAPT